MKVQLISDLHLEFENITLPGGDVLIVAGDVCEAKNLKQERYQDFWFNNAHKYREILYVLGNHEHYGMQVQKTKDLVKDYLPGNVKLLENETHTIDDVLFVGSTLWTNMNRRDPLTMWHCGQMMSDYKYIKMYNSTANAYHKLIPEHTADLHDRSREYIKLVCEQNADKKIVVVTHMAPSFQSVAEWYKTDTLMNGAFYTDMDEFIIDHPQIQVWCHGHMHNRSDYMIGSTRVLCNPRGYAGHEAIVATFDPTFGFEI